MRAFLFVKNAEVTPVPALEKDISLPVAEVSSPLLACALSRESWDQRNMDGEVLSS